MNDLETKSLIDKEPVIKLISALIEDDDLLEVERIKDKAVRMRGDQDWPSNEFDDLVEYTQLPRSLVAHNMVRGADMVASRWMREQPQTKEQIDDFYRHCSEYVYLVAYHAMMLGTYRKLLRVFKHETGGQCLNFGGGVGAEALKLALQGNEVWFCDVPDSPVWKFAQWRAQKAQAAIHFVAEVPAEVQFDFAVAFNVFQILTAGQLKTFLPPIVAALKPEGRLYCQNDFAGAQRVDPEKLRTSLCWQGRVAQHHDHSELWQALTAELGLQKVTEQVYTKTSS